MQKLSDAAVKAAKKSLKKEESGQMKLKALVKKVVLKVDDKSLTAAVVKDLIQTSSKFVVDGKLVMLKRKGSGEAEKPPKKVKRNCTSASSSKASDSSMVDDSNVEEWRKQNKIVVLACKDEEVEKAKKLQSTFLPFSTFEKCDGKIKPALIDQCTKVNKFTKPSPIQAQSWPILTADRDMVGIAETGSGKTLAFCLTALSSMSSSALKGRSKKARMLVLAPTRELAMQSAAVLDEFGAVVSLQSLTIYGGVAKHTQINALKRGVDCLVATPGRLKDLINMQACDLSGIVHLVLDEADRMLDMGFEEDVRFIIEQCPAKRQTCMFSATWPTAIREIAGSYMQDPVRVYVGFESIAGDSTTVDDSLSANKRVQQTVEVIEDRARDARLRQVLKNVHKNNNRVLVFALYKKEAERLEHSLRRDGFNCCSIHGNKNQHDRTSALAQFKDGSCPLLIATDVAARGLDIPNVEAVINFTFPLTIEDYVHRIGRTGRAGKTGVAYTFFQPGDKSHAGELQQILKQVDQDIPQALANFGSTIKKKEHKLYGNFGPKDGITKKATKITFDYDSE